MAWSAVWALQPTESFLRRRRKLGDLLARTRMSPDFPIPWRQVRVATLEVEVTLRLNQAVKDLAAVRSARN